MQAEIPRRRAARIWTDIEVSPDKTVHATRSHTGGKLPHQKVRPCHVAARDEGEPAGLRIHRMSVDSAECRALLSAGLLVYRMTQRCFSCQSLLLMTLGTSRTNVEQSCRMTASDSTSQLCSRHQRKSGLCTKMSPKVRGSTTSAELMWGPRDKFYIGARMKSSYITGCLFVCPPPTIAGTYR